MIDRKPSGVLRAVLRAPIWLYRARLGWIVGHRLAYIAHRGRRTGARREVVAEVVRFDAALPELIVVAAWGKNPDWYQNLTAAPAVEVRVAAQRWPRPITRFLDDTETLHVLACYRRQHPHLWSRLAPRLGFPTDIDDSSWPIVIRAVHGIAFRPNPDEE